MKRAGLLGAEGDLSAMLATIEGEPHGDDGAIPDPPGSPVHVHDGKAFVRVEPNSLAFVVIDPRRPIPLCRR